MEITVKVMSVHDLLSLAEKKRTLQLGKKLVKDASLHSFYNQRLSFGLALKLKIVIFTTISI